MKNSCFALIFIVWTWSFPLAFSQTESASASVEMTINSEDLRNAPKIKLRFGQQGQIRERPFLLDLGNGYAHSFLFELPALRKEVLKLELSSHLHNSMIYYPVIVKLNDNFEIQELIKEELDISGTPAHRAEHTSFIEVDNTTRYILLTTDPAMKGKSVIHFYESSEMLAVHTGITPIFVPSASRQQFSQYKFTTIPQISIRVASANNREIFRREQGYYFGLGAAFGGEKVADNPGGDSYRAGGGATISLGFGRSVFSSDFVMRFGLGMRYQGSQQGKGSNRGIFTEIMATWQTPEINIGLGGQLDAANSVTDSEGKIIAFRPALGPKISLEYRVAGMGNIGLEYLPVSFNTTNNVRYSGNRIALAMKFFLNR
jgi:hypothetical protein